MMIHRTLVEVLDLMARSLRNAFPAGAGAVNLAQLVAPRFHALCGPEVNTPAYDSAFWLARLGNAGASLFGGVHLMTDVNPFANRTRNYQWNYMAKAMAMPRIAALAGYDHVVSTDDDVLIPPHVWRTFAWAAAAPTAKWRECSHKKHSSARRACKKTRAAALDAWQRSTPVAKGSATNASNMALAGCTVVTPLIHNGVPQGRAFAEALGPAAVRALDSCFAKSKLGVMGSIRMDLISMPINPWNESKWWAALARLPGVFKGAHPIRYDKRRRSRVHARRACRRDYARRCMTLSLELAMARIDAWWDRTLDAGLGQLAVHGPGVRPYSYFTNTLWMASVEHYAAAFGQSRPVRGRIRRGPAEPLHDPGTARGALHAPWEPHRPPCLQ